MRPIVTEDERPVGIPQKNKIHRSVFDLRHDFYFRTMQTIDGPQDVLILIPGRMQRLREEIFPETALQNP
jgi:hypothetical protein